MPQVYHNILFLLQFVVHIPNTMVKTQTADDTILETDGKAGGCQIKTK